VSCPGADPRTVTVEDAPREQPSHAAAGPDRESQRWLRRLRSDGSKREAALAELHRLFVRVAHGEANRRRGSLPDAVAADLDDLCLQAADDALVAVVAKLDRYAGRSRFTTWAMKFVLLETSMRLRRHAWRGRPVKLDDEAWTRIGDPGAASPQPSTSWCSPPQAPCSARRRGPRGARMTDALLRSLLGHAGADPGCDAAFELMDRYVEAQLAGQDADARFPGVAAHLRNCAACREDAGALHRAAARCSRRPS